MLISAMGHSSDIDLDIALNEVIKQCQQGLDGHKPTAGILYVGGDLDMKRVARTIQDAFPDCPISGCSTAGESSSMAGFSHDSIALWLCCSNKVRAGSGVGHNLSIDVKKACQQAVTQARNELNDEEVGLCFLFASQSGNDDLGEVVQQLRSELGSNVCVVGGGAAGYGFDAPLPVFQGGEIHRGSIAILVFSKALLFSSATATGWKPAGKIGTITRCQGKVIHEIDNKPASSFYQILLGSAATTYFGVPLAVLESSEQNNQTNDANGENYQSFNLRTLSGIDLQAGTLTVSSAVPQGSKVQISYVNNAMLLDGARQSIETCRKRFKD